MTHQPTPETTDDATEPPETEACDTPTASLVPAIRASLSAKLERLLRRPLIASVVRPTPPPSAFDDAPEVFRLLRAAADESVLATPSVYVRSPWSEDPLNGTCTVAIHIDYLDLWRTCEKEVLATVVGTLESAVVFLTDEQRDLLERAPREFLALNPRPESAELLTYNKVLVGGADRVFELTVAEPPKSKDSIRHIAIVPNLIPLERQLAALKVIEGAPDDGPLAPLRVLTGLAAASVLAPPAEPQEPSRSPVRLDDHQKECVEKALSTPHFAVIKGPPGSGKTTVITTVIQRALARGEKVLVVSPTHVAVDNVIEKLTPRAGATDADDLEVRSLPVRFASRPKRLLESAHSYWVGPKTQRRAATLSLRIQGCLSAHSDLAKSLYGKVDPREAGRAPLSQAIDAVHDVIAGTPIGVLSFDAVKHAAPGAFDLLIVDEVSKMTLPEFLAVAVKARRWVLVGDPDQLPPYNNADENGTTLDDVVDPLLDLACSVASILEWAKPGERSLIRLVVVSSEPERAMAAIRAHVGAVGLDHLPPLSLAVDGPTSGIVVCTSAGMHGAIAALSPVAGRDRTHNPSHTGTVEILVERGVWVPRPALESGTRFVETKLRASSRMFDTAVSVYHAQPWSVRASHKLNLVTFRKGLNKCMPSAAAIASLNGAMSTAQAAVAEWTMTDRIAERLAVNTVSVYDWLAGIPVDYFDTSPLRELSKVALPLAPLRQAVEPYVGTLKKQYRMHPSLSRVPRDLFYFGEALHDGAPSATTASRVTLYQVDSRDQSGESNSYEANAIFETLQKLNEAATVKASQPRFLVVTPYRDQERRLNDMLDAFRAEGGLANVDVEVCTLDRCQGREADYVFISLVRSKATAFFDWPKRWNVALTRAMQGLVIFGDIRAYLQEAEKARRVADGAHGDGRPRMSLLARILEAYHDQNNSCRRVGTNGVSA